MVDAVVKAFEGPVAKFVQSLLPSDYDDFLRKRTVTKTVKLAKIDFATAYQNYLIDTLERTSTVRNSLLNSGQVLLESIYVAPSLSDRAEITLKYNPSLFTDAPGISLITGTACQGKSTLSKKLFLDLLRDGRLPILIEFSRMSDHYLPFQSLQEVVEMTESQIMIKILNELDIVLIFDGLDEVPPPKLNDTLLNLDRLQRYLPLIPIVITSRPFSAGECPYRRKYSLLPFAKNEVLSSLNNLKPFIGNADEISQKISDFLYDEYPEIFSIPLFAQIYAVAYESGFSRSVPGAEMQSIFFNDIFETLLKRHDLSKDIRLERSYFTSLNELQFRRVHEWVSVSKGGHPTGSMTRQTLLETIERVMKRLEIIEAPEKLLEDIVVSIGVIVRDGNHYEWLHRSFQEFFLAHFIISSNSKEIQRKLLSTQISNDSLCLKFIRELNPGFFERNFIMPILSEYLENLNIILEDSGRTLALGLTRCCFLQSDPKEGKKSNSIQGRGLYQPEERWISSGFVVSGALLEFSIDYTCDAVVANLSNATRYVRRVLRFFDGPPIDEVGLNAFELFVNQIFQNAKAEGITSQDEFRSLIHQSALEHCRCDNEVGFLSRLRQATQDAVEELTSNCQTEDTNDFEFIFNSYD